MTDFKVYKRSKWGDANARFLGIIVYFIQYGELQCWLRVVENDKDQTTLTVRTVGGKYTYRTPFIDDMMSLIESGIPIEEVDTTPKEFTE